MKLQLSFQWAVLTVDRSRPCKKLSGPEIVLPPGWLSVGGPALQACPAWLCLCAHLHSYQRKAVAVAGQILTAKHVEANLVTFHLQGQTLPCRYRALQRDLQL